MPLPLHADTFMSGDDHGVYQMATEAEARLVALEKAVGLHGAAVDNPDSPPAPPNPPPINPPGLSVGLSNIGSGNGIWTVLITAPQDVQPLTAAQVSAFAQVISPQGFGTIIYNLQSSIDQTFQTNVVDYGRGNTHYYSIPGASNLWWRVRCTIDGRTWGPWSPVLGSSQSTSGTVLVNGGNGSGPGGPAGAAGGTQGTPPPAGGGIGGGGVIRINLT